MEKVFGRGLKYGILFGIAIGFILFFVLVACTSDYFFPSVNNFPGMVNGGFRGELNAASKTALVDLVKSGAVLLPQDVITNITNFYGAVIAFASLLIALVGVTGFFYVKAVSIDRAEEAANAAIERLDVQLNEKLLARMESHTYIQVYLDQLKKSFAPDLDKIRESLARIDIARSEYDDAAVKIEELSEKISDLRESIDSLDELVRDMASERRSEDGPRIIIDK